MSKSKLDIKRAMAEHGINNTVLSERTGIGKGNISKLFYGNPTLSKLEDVADAIGIDIRDLFYPVDEDGNFVESLEVINKEKEQPSQSKVGVVICPNCHCGIEITGVVTQAAKNGEV